MELIQYFMVDTSFIQKLIILIVFFVCLFIFIFLVKTLIIKNGTFKGKWFGADVEFSKNNPEYIIKGALVDVFNMAMTTASEISYIKTKQVLSEQMSFLEDRLILIQASLNNTYRKCLSDCLTKINTPLVTVTSNKEYHLFSTILTLMLDDQKEYCRDAFIKNNFAHLNDNDFNDYLDDKLNILYSRCISYVRDLYPSDKMLVTYEIVESDVFGSTKKEFFIRYTQVFKKAALLYRTKHLEADTKDIKLKEYIKMHYAVDIDAPYIAIQSKQNV